MKISLETGKHENNVLLVKLLDNLLSNRLLYGKSAFFLMFSKLSHQMYGWFIHPFHISITVIRGA
jgi:hypothetical protein